MNMAPSTKRFHMLTEEEVRSDWENGLSSAAKYLLEIVRVSRAIGWELNIESVPEFCDRWGMQERTFYRAKAKLISQGLLSEKIVGRVSLKITSTDKLDIATDKLDIATPLKELSGKGFKDSPDLLHTSYISSSDLSHTEFFVENSDLKAEKTENLDLQSNPSHSNQDSVEIKPVIPGKSGKRRSGSKSSGGALAARKSEYTEPFEVWWKSYREMCLSCGPEAGSKASAFKEWQKSPEVYESELFQRGNQAYLGFVIQQFATRGQVFGVAHGERYLRSEKWQEALDRLERRQSSGFDLANPVAVRAAAAQSAKQNEWQEARRILGIEDEVAYVDF